MQGGSNQWNGKGREGECDASEHAMTGVFAADGSESSCQKQAMRAAVILDICTKSKIINDNVS